MTDKDVVAQKLESLRRCIQRIREKTPAGLTELVNDYDLQDIICINLERAVQICVDIASHILADADPPVPGSMAESFDRLADLSIIPLPLVLRLKKAVGFRNITVHAYREIDWEIVYRIITRHLDDFSTFAGCAETLG